MERNQIHLRDAKSGPQVAAGEAECGVKHFSWEEEDRMSFQQVECQALTGYLCWNIQSLLLLTHRTKTCLIEVKLVSGVAGV